MPGNGNGGASAETMEAPATRAEAAKEAPTRPVERPHSPLPPIRVRRRRPWKRAILFMLLPLALVAGGYWYVTGGSTMATDDAYVEAGQGGRVDGYLRHRQDGRGARESACRSRAGAVPAGRPAVPTGAAKGGRDAGDDPQRYQRAEGQLPGHPDADQTGAGRCRLLYDGAAPHAGSAERPRRVASGVRHGATQSAETPSKSWPRSTASWPAWQPI